MDEYEASGLGRQEFCKKYGLSLTTLNRHRKRKQLRKETPERRLIPVETSAAKQQASKERAGELLVWLSRGGRIEVRGSFDARVLEQLVRVLEQA